MRRRRWIVRIGMGLVAVVVFLLLSGWLLLRSSYVANQVAARIQAAMGAPVRVGTVSVGLGGSTLSGLEFLEEGAAPGSPPWAIIPDVRADLSLPQLARGELSGGTVVLRNAAVTLRLDRDDKLLTKLPSPEGDTSALPVFRLENATVTFQREGRSDTVFRSLSGEVQSDPDTFRFSGAANDPEWGNWTLAGERNRHHGATTFTVRTDKVHLTENKLWAVPFVPAVTWEHVRAEGETPVDLTLRLDSSDPTPHYRVALAPTATRLHVSSIDLTAEQAAGSVVVEDGLVTVTKVAGRAAGGELATDATLDFRGDASVMTFDVTANQLVLKQVPASWKLPPFDGKMSGRANLKLTVKDSRVQTAGEGDGTIEGFLSGPPLKVKMLAHDRGYRFDITNEPGARRAPSTTSPAAWLLGSVLVSLQPPLVTPVPPATPPQPGKEPAFNDIQINLGLKNVDLAELIQRLNVTVPFKLAGRLTFQVQAHVPMNNVKELKAYRFRGTVELPWVKLEDLELKEVKARTVYEQGVLRLEELSARVPEGMAASGTVTGTATLGLVPATDLSAQLKLDRLPVGRLLEAIPNVDAGGGGTASGEVTLRAPAEQLRDLTKWEATGRLDARDLRVFGRSAEELNFRLKLESGTLTLTEARGRLQGASVTGRGTLQVTAPYRYEAHLALPPSDLKALQDVVPDLRGVRLAGQVRADADARGTLSPLTVQAGGNARVDDLAINDFKVGTLRTRYDLDADRVRLTDLSAGLYGGELVGTATIPLKDSVAGQIDLDVKKLDTANLTKDVPQTPFRLEGSAAGTIRATIPPKPPDGDREITADVRLSADRLRVQNIPADRLTATVTYRSGAADYRVEGETLGGKFELTGQYPSRRGQPPADGEGRLRVRDIDLSRLADAFRAPGLRPLGGRFSLTTDFRPEGPGGEPTGDGQVTLTDLSWDRREILSEVRGDVRVGLGEVRLREVSALIAGGTLRAQVAYNYRDPRRSFVTLTLDRADARTLLAPYTDSPPLDGPVDIRVRGRVGAEWYGTAEVLMGRGTLFGLTVRDARFPLAWSATPGRRGQLRLTDATAQASMGRLTGRAEYSWGSESRLDGVAQFVNVDAGELLSDFTSRRVVGGRASGRVTFGGRNIQSASDVTATVEATLAETQAAQMPVMRQLVPFILPGRSASAIFRSGELRGTLAGGVFRVQRLTLIGDAARVFAEGTVTLQERLNLDVVANTNQLGIDPNVLRLVGLSIPAVGPIPVGLINQASSYLSNRTVRLHVGGTISAPSIRVNATRLLSESAVRFFINQSGVPIPSVPGVGIP